MERKAPEFADLPLSELLRRFASDVAELVRQELRLAKLELSEKGRAFGQSIGKSIAFFAIAALLGVGMFAALTATLIAALAIVVPLWAAALIVTIVYALAAVGAGLAGKKALTGLTAPVPDRTIASVKADVAAIASGIRRAR